VAVPAELLELIRCPRCRGRLAALPSEPGLSCAACRVFYPVVDDIPLLLVDEARPLPGVGAGAGGA
jgi:hypothetical protein